MKRALMVPRRGIWEVQRGARVTYYVPPWVYYMRRSFGGFKLFWNNYLGWSGKYIKFVGGLDYEIFATKIIIIDQFKYF